MYLLRRLFSLIFNRYLLVVLGIAALVLAIWFVGPLFAFADWRPLETVEARLWLIGIVFFLIFLRILIGFWRRKRINGRLLDAAMNLRKSARAEDDANPAITELETNFARAISRLKSNNVGASKDGWWGRLQRKYVYQIPWYVFIGAPGSGKTTALVNSGLNFPLADELGRKQVKGVGGTRNCDWWFTDEAVLLDTAGRYTIQESDAEADKSEWEGFLKLLKKYRPRQPFNGAILTISVQDLLGVDEDGRARLAVRLRARLSELYSTLGITFPVYVLVTKADLLGGFNEYFFGLSKEDRAQVWGASFPYQETDTKQENGDVGGKIASEMELLVRRLFDRLPDVLLGEHDLSRRSLAYALPQHFSRIIPLLEQVLQNVFEDNRYLPNATLRGVYFTSGTQEGTPFDRVLSALGKSLGYDTQVSLQSSRAVGKSYFLPDLFRKVVFPEAHLAGRNRQAERRERILALVGHGVVAVTLIAVVTAWGISFQKNKGYIDLVGTKTEKLAGETGVLEVGEGADLLKLLPVLSELQHLADGEHFTADYPPLDYTYGLYQGMKLSAVAQAKYQKGLENTLLPHIVRGLESQLKTIPADNLELSYETLKAYLMINQPEHYDSEALETFVRLDWDRSLPLSVSRERRDELFVHLHNLLKRGAVVSPFPADEALIANCRERLAGYSPAQRAYIRLKRRLSDDARLATFNVADAGGPQAALVFARKSGKPLTQGISGLFTYHGYHDVFRPGLLSSLSALEDEERWVIGQPPTQPGRQFEQALRGAIERDVLGLYLHEYVRIWDEYLADVRLRDSQSISQSIETARIMSAPDSPIAQFLRGVSRETTLLRQENNNDNISVVGQAARRVRTAKQDLERVFGPNDLTSRGADASRLERIVDDRFEPIRRLVTSNGGTAPIDATLRLFNDLYMNLSSADAALRTGATTAGQNEVLMRVRAEAARLPVPLRTTLEGLADTGGAQAAGNARRTLGDALDSGLGNFCRNAIHNRYPFTRTSPQDVTLGDFSRLFAPGGMFDQFYSERLASMTDMSGPTWILRQPDTPPLPLGSFQKASRIRDAFFPSSSRSPEMAFDIRVLEMDANITQLTLDVDGQVVRYAHGPQVPQRIAWPGPKGSGQIRMELASVGDSHFVSKSGPWALMRFFDEGGGHSVLGPERFSMTITAGGRKVVFEVTATSVMNPFSLLPELGTFACPSRI